MWGVGRNNQGIVATSINENLHGGYRAVILDDATPGRRASDAVFGVHRDDHFEPAAPTRSRVRLRRSSSARPRPLMWRAISATNSAICWRPGWRGCCRSQRAVPLLWFGVFERAETCDARALDSPRPRLCRTAAARMGRGRLMASAFDRVHDYIEGGDIYQANLSFRSRFAFAGDPLALYQQSSRAIGGGAWRVHRRWRAPDLELFAGAVFRSLAGRRTRPPSR